MSRPIETITVPAGKGATLNAAVWENEVEQDNKRFTTYSVTIEKRYRDGDEWKTSKSFKAGDLLAVAYLANRSYERALQLRQGGDAPRAMAQAH